MHADTTTSIPLEQYMYGYDNGFYCGEMCISVLLVEPVIYFFSKKGITSASLCLLHQEMWCKTMQRSSNPIEETMVYTYAHYSNAYVYVAWDFSSCCNFELAQITLHGQTVWPAGERQGITAQNLTGVLIRSDRIVTTGEYLWFCVIKAIKLNRVCIFMYKQ